VNEYRFIFQSFVTIVKASTLAQAYQILEREGAVKEQTLLNVECKAGSRASLSDFLRAADPLIAGVAKSLDEPSAA